MGKGLVVFLMALLLVFVLPMVVLADDDTTTPGITDESSISGDTGSHGKALGKDKQKENRGDNKDWIAAKDTLEQEKDAIEALKNEVESQLDVLEAQYDAAELANDTASMETLKTQIDALKAQQTTYKVQMKEKIEQMKLVIKAQYTLEELAQLQNTEEEFSKDGLDVIPVENVLVRNGNIKFDTPPVIKYGRTLLPLRAISEGMGAEVDYIAETNSVVIVKDGVEIIFSLSDNKVLINGVETAVDVNGEILNNRTMVPLRFIAETLGIKVQYDPDNKIIEIDTDTDDETDTETQPDAD